MTSGMFIVYVCGCSGQSPADADLSLLDIARKIEHYGLRLYPAKVAMSFSYIRCLTKL